MPDLLTTKQAIKKLLGIDNSQTNSQLKLETSATTVASSTTRGEIRVQNVDDSTNDEYLEIGAHGNDAYYIQSKKTGTGSNRNLYLNTGSTYISVATGGISLGGTVGFDSVVTFGDFIARFHNPAFTATYNVGTSAIAANRNITLPLLTGHDTFVFEVHAQTLTNKSLTAPIMTSFIEYDEIADPSAPSANKGRVFFDNTDEHLKIIKSSGTVVDLEAPREDLQAQWDEPKTWTNIGTSYVDVYVDTNGAAHETNIDFTGKTQYRMIALWNKIGSGTQQLKSCQVATPTNVLHNFSNIASGRNDSGLTSLPGWATGVQQVKLMALSSTAADDPIFVGARIWLK